MTFDLKTVLPADGVEVDSYKDPHEVYLMLMLAFTMALEGLMQQVPAQYRSLSKLRNLGKPPVFWGDLLVQIGGEWVAQNRVEESPAMVESFLKAHRKVMLQLYPEFTD